LEPNRAVRSLEVGGETKMAKPRGKRRQNLSSRLVQTSPEMSVGKRPRQAKEDFHPSEPAEVGGKTTHDRTSRRKQKF